MKRRVVVIMLLVATLLGCSKTEEIYIFSYFKGDGEDGLHLSQSSDGLKWREMNGGKSLLTPTVGKDRLMRDPSIIKGDDDCYHMVWTTGWNDRGIGYASTKDFISWSEQIYIPVMEHQEGTLNCWAPEITYDSRNERYIIYWSSSISGSYPDVNPDVDHGYNHRIFYTSTTDFKEFSRAKILYDKGFTVIDATIKEVDNEYIMFIKDERLTPLQKNIRVAKSRYIDKNFTDPSEPITGNYQCEGPTSIKIGDNWIVYFDKFTQGEMGAVTSTDLNSWTDISDSIEFPEGTRHGSIIAVPKKLISKISVE